MFQGQPSLLYQPCPETQALWPSRTAVKPQAPLTPFYVPQTYRCSVFSINPPLITSLLCPAPCRPFPGLQLSRPVQAQNP